MSSRPRHKAQALAFLESPFVVYVGNVPVQARTHFAGIKAAYPRTRGLLLIDHTDTELQAGPLQERMWRRREIENYLLVPSAILRFCESELKRQPKFAASEQDLFTAELDTLRQRTADILRKRILPEAYASPAGDDPFLVETKASDVVLEPFFREFYATAGAYNAMPKKHFFRLADAMTAEEVHPEVGDVLDAIGALHRADDGGGE